MMFYLVSHLKMKILDGFPGAKAIEASCATTGASSLSSVALCSILRGGLGASMVLIFAERRALIVKLW